MTTTTTTLLGTARKADITFCHTGRIEISARLAGLLHIVPGSSIDIAVTPDREYIIFARPKPLNAPQHSYKCRCTPTRKGYHTMRCSSIKLSRAILSLTGQTTKARLTVGEPTTYNAYPAAYLIIHNILPS
ncbi:MAG: hypothetical protein ACI4OZ_09195 [Akkermansia sp.]